MLYLISTPIGNLDDISYRAVKILSSCDYILCEDTRKSVKLLNHLKIKKKIVSYHKFSEAKKLTSIIEDLENNKEIALISDGGTPIICDPGLLLLKKAIEKNIEYTALPGPCSIINALVLSGFDSIPFQFLGFLEKKPSSLKKQLKKMVYYDGVSIAFESPKRLLKTLKEFDKIDPEKNLVVARELTKKFEEIKRGKAKELYNHFIKKSVKGEIVLIAEKNEVDFKELDVHDLLKFLVESGNSPKEALKLAQKIKKEKLYNKVKKL